MVGGDNNTPRRIRRSEALLKQAADCVSRGQTFQHVSDMFSIPISTIRYVHTCLINENSHVNTNCYTILYLRVNRHKKNTKSF